MLNECSLTEHLSLHANEAKFTEKRKHKRFLAGFSGSPCPSQGSEMDQVSRRHRTKSKKFIEIQL